MDAKFGILLLLLVPLLAVGLDSFAIVRNQQGGSTLVARHYQARC